MRSLLLSGFRQCSLIMRKVLSPTLALVAPSAVSLHANPVYAQVANDLPPIVISSQKPRTSQNHTATQSLQAVTAPDRTSHESSLVPADTATISHEAALSRGLGTSDSASLINDIPGGAAWGAGGVSSLPAINGMGADRIQVAINSMLISPACPNEMNPPLSFVNPAMITKMRAYLGIAPVSVGGDYIGAKIDVTTAPPQFTTGSGWITSTMLSGFFRSNSKAYGIDTSATIANKDTSITYTGGWVRAGNYTAGDGTKVKSTMYESQNHALGISKQNFGNLYTLQIGGQFIPYQGYVNQYMDMVFNRSLYMNGRYEGRFDWGKFEASAFVHQIRHTMGFIAPDKTGDMPMDTKSIDSGYSLQATIAASRQDLIRIGNEFYNNRLDDWWNPVMGSMMMGPDKFINISNGQRSRLGTFVEWERHWANKWTTVVGWRNDIVWMNAGNVQGYNPMDYGPDAAAFNALNHAKTDINFDGSALIRYEPDHSSLFELGFAHKTRSPNLYERYAWSTNMMAMNMIGWFGDGNGYVGNINLKTEKARTVSFTAGWHDPEQKYWGFKVSPYYSYVQDYIDVDRCQIGECLNNLATNLTERKNFVYLQFANHDASLYGVNIDGKLALWENPTYGRGEFRGTFGYVRGQRTDRINLYHIMPVSAKLALDHTLGGWNNSIELQLAGSKDQTSQVHNELPTPAYALINLRTGYQWQAVRVDFGIDNLFNKYYVLPLGGADLVNHQVTSMMGTSAAYGFNVPAPGRSFNGRLTVKF